MNDYFRNDRFAEFLGMETLERGPGFAKAKLTVTENHRNGFGIVHGGVTFALADHTFALAANAGEQMGVALEVHISFIKAGISGALHAEAREVSRSRRVGIYDIRVTDDRGDLLALFRGTAYFKDAPESRGKP